MRTGLDLLSSPRRWSPSGVPLVERVVRDLLAAVGLDHRDADVAAVGFSPLEGENPETPRSGVRVFLDPRRVLAVSAPDGLAINEPRGSWAPLSVYLHSAPSEHVTSTALLDGLYDRGGERGSSIERDVAALLDGLYDRGGERGSSIERDVAALLDLGGRELLPNPEYGAIRALAVRRPEVFYPGHLLDAASPLGVRAGSGELARVGRALVEGAPDEWALRLLDGRLA